MRNTFIFLILISAYVSIKAHETYYYKKRYEPKCIHDIIINNRYNDRYYNCRFRNHNYRGSFDCEDALYEISDIILRNSQKRKTKSEREETLENREIMKQIESKLKEGSN